VGRDLFISFRRGRDITCVCFRGGGGAIKSGVALGIYGHRQPGLEGYRGAAYMELPRYRPKSLIPVAYIKEVTLLRTAMRNAYIEIFGVHNCTKTPKWLTR
jgi:hypothetical protein